MTIIFISIGSQTLFYCLDFKYAERGFIYLSEGATDLSFPSFIRAGLFINGGQVLKVDKSWVRSASD